MYIYVYNICIIYIQVAGLLLSNLAADKENALAIADTHRAVR